MKDGRTHLAHKAEHAVDLETGAIVGVTVQDADDGDTTTSIETLIEAAEQVEAVRPDGEGIKEVVGDKGYRGNQSLVDLEAVGIRSYSTGFRMLDVIARCLQTCPLRANADLKVCATTS
jgi:transposase